VNSPKLEKEKNWPLWTPTGCTSELQLWPAKFIYADIWESALSNTFMAENKDSESEETTTKPVLEK
jgi:hypothetical protein